jgi:hypothetical protein
LLAAYRTPSLDDPLDAPPAASPIPYVPPVRPAPARVAGPSPEVVAQFELDDARRRLLWVLAEPKRDAAMVVARYEVEKRAAEAPPARERPRVPAVPSRESPGRPSPPRTTPRSTRPASQTLPGRPGYVVRGTVEPVLVVGIVLFVLACFVFAIGSFAGSLAWAAVGFVVAAVGLLTAIGAVLVALVRRDNERR